MQLGAGPQTRLGAENLAPGAQRTVGISDPVLREVVDDLLDDITLARGIREMTRGMTGKRRAVIMLDCRRTQQIEDVGTRPGCATYEPKLLARRRGRVEIPAQVPCGLKQGLARPLGVSANQRRFRPARQTIVALDRGSVRSAIARSKGATSVQARALGVAGQQIERSRVDGRVMIGRAGVNPAIGRCCGAQCGAPVGRRGQRAVLGDASTERRKVELALPLELETLVQRCRLVGGAAPRQHSGCKIAQIDAVGVLGQPLRRNIICDEKIAASLGGSDPVDPVGWQRVRHVGCVRRRPRRFGSAFPVLG